MKTISILLPALLIILLSSCNKKVTPVQAVQEAPPPLPVVEEPVDPEMIRGNNAFAFELYRSVRSEKENTFFSPFSISTAMCMTYAGARGESEKQIASVMHFSPGQSKVHASYKSYLKFIAGLNRGDSIQMAAANALWAQKDYAFLDSYFRLITDNYGAEAQNLDFRGDPEKARQTINLWVEEQTSEKILELIAEGMLDDMTRLVLVNAIYYYGLWDQAFDPLATRSMDFNTDAEKTVKADFLYKRSEYRFAENEKLKIVEIPYKGKEISMFVLLPAETGGMADIEKQLNEKNWNLWMEQMGETKIELMLPKFKTTSEIELSETLKNMGMPHPFSMDADLSGMTGKMDLMIDKVIHKAFVEVNEKGTEAAAATAVVIREKSAPVMPVFRADHPFIFVIRENAHHSILFMGRINDPTK